MTPRSDAAIRDDFPAIMAEVRARLETGKLTYGDDSFERPLAEVVAELRQEALDIIGWGFILCARVKHLQRLALEATTPHRPTADGPRVPVVMSWPGGCSAVIGEAPDYELRDPRLVHSAPSSTPHGQPDATGYVGDGAPD